MGVCDQPAALSHHTLKVRSSATTNRVDSVGSFHSAPTCRTPASIGIGLVKFHPSSRSPNSVQTNAVPWSTTTIVGSPVSIHVATTSVVSASLNGPTWATPRPSTDQNVRVFVESEYTISGTELVVS